MTNEAITTRLNLDGGKAVRVSVMFLFSCACCKYTILKISNTLIFGHVCCSLS